MTSPSPLLSYKGTPVRSGCYRQDRNINGQNGSPKINSYINGKGRNVTQKNQCRKEELTLGQLGICFLKNHIVILILLKNKV